MAELLEPIQDSWDKGMIIGGDDHKTNTINKK